MGDEKQTEVQVSNGGLHLSPSGLQTMLLVLGATGGSFGANLYATDTDTAVLEAQYEDIAKDNEDLSTALAAVQAKLEGLSATMTVTTASRFTREDAGDLADRIDDHLSLIQDRILVLERAHPELYVK